MRLGLCARHMRDSIRLELRLPFVLILRVISLWKMAILLFSMLSPHDGQIFSASAERYDIADGASRKFADFHISGEQLAKARIWTLRSAL
jgi:hypothetical protein